MAGCNITNGIGVTCDDLRRIGGQEKTVYFYNIDDLDTTTPYTETNSYISALTFQTYKGLYKFTARKDSHAGGDEVVVQEGGNKYFQHNATIKAFISDPTDAATIEELIVANVGIIMVSRNGDIKLYGKENGMEVTEGAENSGAVSNSDTTQNLTFMGEEKEKPKFVSIAGTGADKDATIAYLETLVV